MNYKLLCENGIFLTDIKETIARNRGLPVDWCKREFTKKPSFEFAGLKNASRVFLLHSKLAEIQGANTSKQKIQIIVDSDLDGIASAAILYKFMKEFYSEIETTYSIHTGKRHGLSEDIVIDEDTTLVICPDAASNDVEQAKALADRDIDVICLDHHIIEQDNPYAFIVSCMDGVYSNQDLCGAAVTWLFLYGFAIKRVQSNNDMIRYLLSMLDLVAIATISDIMLVTNEDNMYFIQNGLSNIHSNVLKAFLNSQEIPLDDVTIEHIKFKVAPLISAMIRMGSMEEKNLLFRAFIDDYEEFVYEKRGSLDVTTENIYDRVVRLCKNAKSRQDRAKEKILKENEVNEYDCVVLMEYDNEQSSTLTGLVANELANKYAKPCIVYRNIGKKKPEDDDSYCSGSIRNYDGSPIPSFKALLESAFMNDCEVHGHDNAAGCIMIDGSQEIYAELIRNALDKKTLSKIGNKEYIVDFEIDSEDVDMAFVKRMSYFDNYTGCGFREVLVLVNDIRVSSDNFKTMGKNVFSWKISNDDVSYVKFKIPDNDPLKLAIDDIDFSDVSKSYTINAICSFGFNVYNGTIYAQAIVKDYEIVEEYNDEREFDDDDDLDFDI